MQSISSYVLKKMDWDVTNEIDSSIKKAVIIVTPNTSLWVTFIGKLCFRHLGVDSKLLI